MPLNTIIPELNFAKFQQAVVVMLAAEVLNQKTLFLDANPGEEDRFKSDYEFYVADGRFYTEDISKYPLVNVWVGAGAPINNTISKLHNDLALHFDLFAYRKTEQLDNGDVIEATTGADRRLNYLMAQVWYTLEAQQNLWKGAIPFFSSCTYENFKKLPPDKTTAGVPVIMARMTYSLKTEDIKEELEGWDVGQFITDLKVNTKLVNSLIINI